MLYIRRGLRWTWVPLINDKEDMERLIAECTIRVHINHTMDEFIIVMGVYFLTNQNAEITNEAKELISVGGAVIIGDLNLNMRNLDHANKTHLVKRIRGESNTK
ncbi:hypothetical protein EVAR_23307_1 [Eumeta japonica]|uniref:Uncharacterized protein n=1 Tax=Eumeta variegata TaxID=151549 RepID=A0A4C1XX57_EUMVA|nr:hypothetical protein EVAR_23307_1 [Eumeta japonica]